MKVLLLKLKDAMIIPILTNNNLSPIVNVLPGSTPTKYLFAATITQDKIIYCFSCVGYVLFNRNCLKIPYIRHKLCE